MTSLSVASDDTPLDPAPGIIPDLPSRVRKAAIALGVPNRRIEHISDLEWLKRKNFGRRSLAALREFVRYEDPQRLLKLQTDLADAEAEFETARAKLDAVKAEIAAIRAQELVR